MQTALFRTARRWHRARQQPKACARRVVVNLAKDRRRSLGRRVGEVAVAVDAGSQAALTPAVLETVESPLPQAEPSAHPGAHHSAQPGHTLIRTLDFAGLHLTHAEVDGRPGPLYFVIGPDLSLPAEAEKADLDTPRNVDVWFVDDAASGEPQVFVRPPDSSMLFGLSGAGWTRQQLTHLLEHPAAAKRGQD